MAFAQRRYAMVLSSLDRDATPSDDRAARLTMDLRRIMELLTREEKGQVLPTEGALLAAVFDRSLAAAGYAQTLRRRFALANQARPSVEQLHVKLAIHVGQTLLKGMTLAGEEVAIAERIAAKTPAGRIYVSGPACEELDPDMPRGLPRAALLDIPGHADPMPLFELEAEREDSAPDAKGETWAIQDFKPAAYADGPSSASGPNPRKIAVLALAVLSGAAALLWFAPNTSNFLEEFGWRVLRWNASAHAARLHTGMSSTEALAALGEPDSRSQQSGVEMWFYGLSHMRRENGDFAETRSVFKADLCVMFRGGEVAEVDQSPDKDWVISSK